MTIFNLHENIQEIEYLMSFLWPEIVKNRTNLVFHGFLTAAEEYEFLLKVYSKLKSLELAEKMQNQCFSKLDVAERYRRFVFIQKGGATK